MESDKWQRAVKVACEVECAFAAPSAGLPSADSAVRPPALAAADAGGELC